MLIAIEGIDGAGKTHIASRLAAVLSDRGNPAWALNKSDMHFGDTFADSRLALLKEALWPVDGEPKQDLLGTHVYLHLLAAWFAAWGQQMRHQGGADQISIMDGSHYRVMAKAHRRSGLQLGTLEGYFVTAPAPDLVILLDIDPALSFRRREHFKETELGRWDGVGGDPEGAYCAYQASIRSVLLRMANRLGWLVVRQDKHTRDVDVLEHILPRVMDEIAGAPRQRQPVSRAAT